MMAREKLAKMPTLEFEGVISKMGKNRIIWIPKVLHIEAAKFQGKKIRVRIDDRF